MAARTSKTPGRPKRTTPPKKAQRSLLWRFRRSLFLIALLVIAAVAGAGFVLAQVDLPPEEPLVQSTFVCAADVREGCGPDNAIAKLSGEEDRVSVPLEEMPQVFLDAVLAAEDRSFFSHSGIDPVGIGRAIYRDLRSEGVTQGGSTITQQYAKNKFLSSERTVSRKLKEAVLAVKLERELSKEEILQRYLNTVYFGRGAYGAEAAARAYFGKSIRRVGLSEAAYLAGLIRAPETADASRDAEMATFRRDATLDGMLEEGMITQAEHDAATGTPITDLVQDRTVRDGITMLRSDTNGATYYVEYVRRLLYDKYGAEKVNGGGLRVYTSLDMDLQTAAYDAVWGFLDEPDDPAGALVSVDSVGRVVAMVGGEDFDESEVNLALGRAAGGSGRQPGSAFKPVVLATALENGISLSSKFLNENEKVFPDANAGEDWEVSNYAPGEENLIDLTEATRVSSNTAYAELMIEVGPAAVAEVARDLGISAELPVVNSLVLGSGEVSVLDMANAYATFARRGEAIEPIFITRVEQVVDGEVQVLESASTKSEQVLDSNTADQVNWALRQVVLGGTGASADFGVPLAGKTGTTQEFNDAWFVGYSPLLSTAVWMGYPELDEAGELPKMRNVRGRRVTGGSFPAQIWREFMEQALDGEDHGAFVAPDFTGTPLNPDLTTTTTEPPPCGPDGGDDGDGDASTTTEPCTPTTTEPECDPDESDSSGGDACEPVDPDGCAGLEGDELEQCQASTATSEPDGSTTTDPDDDTTTTSDPEETTTTSEPEQSTTTTTQPQDESPTTTEFTLGDG